ncbi:MAG: HD domain-containing phosphohydrolase [Anaerolineales bacterium]
MRPPKNAQNEEAILAYMARMVLFLTAIVLALSTLVIISYWIEEAFDLESMVAILVLDSSLLIGLRMGFIGKWGLGIKILIAILFLLGVYGSINDGISTLSMAYILALILTGIFLGGRRQWVMLGIILAIHLPAIVYHSKMQATTFLPQTITLTALLLGISSLLWFFNNQLRRAISEARFEAVKLQSRSEALEIANQTLIKEIMERKAAENTARQSEERYRRVTELISNFIYAEKIDTEGRRETEWLTDSFARITGYTADEFPDGGWQIELCLTRDQPELLSGLEKVNNGEQQVFEFRIRAKDGTIHWLRNYEYPEWDDSFKRVIRVFGAAQDITDTKDRQREQETFVNLATALRSAKLRPQMFSVILEQTISILFAQGAALALLKPSQKIAVVEMTKGQIELNSGQSFAPGEGFVGQLIVNSMKDASQQLPIQPVSSTQNNNHRQTALIGIPLVQKEIVIGALFVSRRQDFPNTDYRILIAIAEMAASALHRAALHEETERQVQHLAALHTIDKTITSNAEIQTTLMVVLDQAILQLDIDAGAIYLNDTLTQSLSPGVHQGQFKTPLPVSKGMDYQAKRANQEGQIVRLSLNEEVSEADNEFIDWMRREEFIACLSIPLIAKGKVRGVLELYRRSEFPNDPQWNDFVDTLAHQTAIAIENASLLVNLHRSNEELQMAYDRTLEGWAKALELRDKETEGHSQNVTQMTLRLAKAMDVSKEELVHIHRGALLHDIGKMGIPDSILLKPGPLTPDEWKVMKQHPVYAYQLLASIPYLRPSLDIPYCHHEHWDGSGYPNGLKGEQIPLPARIFSIVDVWEALSSDRPYRKAWSPERIRDYLLEQKDKHFDPRIVDVFLDILENPGPDQTGDQVSGNKRLIVRSPSRSESPR